MMVSNRVMWAVLAVAAGAGLVAALMPPARSRWREQDDDQSNRVDEASEDSFPASDPPSFSADTGAPGGAASSGPRRTGAGSGRSSTARDDSRHSAGCGTSTARSRAGSATLRSYRTSTQSRWGYKRAASAVMYLPVPIDTLLNPDGTLQKIPQHRAGVDARDPRSAARRRLARSSIARSTPPNRRRAPTSSAPRACDRISSAAPPRKRRCASHAPGAPTRADVRCDLQMHSDWSDGGQTLEEIIETGMSRGYTHSAVTDHSYGLPIAGGLSMERVAQQHREIDRAQREVPRPLPFAEGHRSEHPRRRLRRHDVRRSSR